jgi:hypothetical protein
VDRGFTKNDDIEWAFDSGIKLWCPPVHSKHGTDPYAPRPDDKPRVADWHRRMASAAGKALCKQRAQAECPDARARRMSLTRLLVRGKHRARAVLLWFALAYNMLRAFALPAGCNGRGKLRWFTAPILLSAQTDCFVPTGVIYCSAPAKP